MITRMQPRRVITSNVLKLVLPTIMFLALAACAVADEYYDAPQIYGLRPRPDKEMALDCIGATGIKARFYPGVVLKVEGFTEASPAEGKLKVGEIITGVNGIQLKGLNPYVALGEALTKAEASDGRMVFGVKADENAEPRKVTITVPVLGEYSDKWPLKCSKSQKIIERAAEYYAKDPGFRDKYFNDKSESGGVPSALACLFLLSTGDDKYLPVVKEYFDKFPEDVKKIGDHTWNNGYNGVACTEYYLRTGDKSVLPIIQYYCDNAKERQCFGCGWQHWGRSIHPRYVAGGLMNPAGAQVLTTLLLAKECGVDVDEDTLNGALKFWYRFVGHGTVPYGDHRGEGGLGSNGKDGMAAAAMRIAMRARGETANYEQALKYLSMSTLTSYPSLVRGHADEGRGDGIWRGIASAYMLDYNPKAYHTAMNRLKWWFDLSRRPSGAIGMAACQRFDDVGSGAGVALAYTAPLKTLQITGAPRSKYAKDFDLPERPWGRDADLAFLSDEPNPMYFKYGKEEPVHVPYYKFGSAYSKASDLDGIPHEEILKNIYHKRYMIRAQAAKALRILGDFDELEKLLGDKDPRVRRAALDGMCDYRYWFHIGKAPMKPEQFTPGIIKAVTKILKDKQESLYVIDGALTVMSLMPPDKIGANLDLVLPFTTHDEWWIRQSAFCALDGAAADEKLLPKVLPTMLEMLVKEDHTMPRGTMLGRLKKILKKRGTDSDAGRQILAANMRAAREREVIAGQRAGEGEYDINQSLDVLLQASPESGLEVAKMMTKRFGLLSTEGLISLTRRLKETLEKVPEGKRDELGDILYGEYRKVLIDRMQSEGSNLALLDTILALTALEDADAGWMELGKNTHAEREWRYTSFEPVGDDFLHHREKKRFRDVKLPNELQNWYQPGFDDSKWKRGKAPIGRGVFEKRKVKVENQSEWREGEFLLMRTTFNLKSADYDYYRISVLANQGFHIYLNGQKIHTYIWWKGDPGYRKIMLGKDHAKLFKKGENHLAVYAGSEYVTGTQVGQIDVYFEGLKESALLGMANANKKSGKQVK